MKKLIFKRFSLLSACLLLIGGSVSAQSKMQYHVALDTVNHYFHVQLRCNVCKADQDTLKLQMPVWAPGYYLIVNFPKNLVDFVATDKDGQALKWQKKGNSEWDVLSAGNSTVNVSYRVYANERSVAESRVESSLAFIAPNGVFMYPEGGKAEPVTVALDQPSNWKYISTSLDKTATGELVAENFDMLYDSPVLMGNQRVEKFEQNGKKYEMAFLTPDGLDSTSLISDVKTMMTTTSLMMGDTPYPHYCFLFLDKGQGGLEHANSQADYTGGSFRFANRADYLRTLSFITHEYFHLYNVKRIRPIELGPFDYQKEVFTPMLWVSEGFTVYYEVKLLLQAGLITPDEALATCAEWIQTIEGQEGHRHMSLRQSSYDIWLNFFNRNANGSATRISYYDKGPIIGLLMDIQIIRLTQGKKSLDDVMRALYRTYYQEKGRGFTEEEFWKTCADVAGQPLDEMRRLVDTTDEIDYANLLAPAGLALDKTKSHLLRSPKSNGQQKKVQRLLLWEKR